MGIVDTKGYLACQTKNNHIDIIEKSTGNVVAHAACMEAFTEDELMNILNRFKQTVTIKISKNSRHVK